MSAAHAPSLHTTLWYVKFFFPPPPERPRIEKGRFGYRRKMPFPCGFPRIGKEVRRKNPL
jgi:hypothetical protein